MEDVVAGAAGDHVVARAAAEIVRQIIAEHGIGETIAEAVHRCPDEIELLKIGAERVVAGGIDRIESFSDVLADGVARGVDAVAVGTEPPEHDVIAGAALQDVVAGVAGQHVVARIARQEIVQRIADHRVGQRIAVAVDRAADEVEAFKVCAERVVE
ncbi:MAG: hypothetical protein FD124_1662 [Alphaproteobacteria bacterium]|nr:MAG: hypothetical protein FD124_1662 [Alphaproteobacteria bacterium]